MMKTIKILPVITIIAAVIGFGSARAQEFYKDKIITFIVGYSPGGTYDQYTRLIARHMGRHLSGNPTRIVENMPGAGGIIAANHLYNRVKPDGLTIGAWASPLILQHIMGNEATKFDGRKVGWLGIPGPYDTACHFNRESGIVRTEPSSHRKIEGDSPPETVAPLPSFDATHTAHEALS